MYALLLLLFAPAADALAAPRFAAREAGEKVLAKAWPLSLPALARAADSPDWEARERAARAGRDGARRALGGALLRDLAAAARVCRTADDWRAFALVAGTHGLAGDDEPWGDPRCFEGAAADAPLRKALARVTADLGLYRADECPAFLPGLAADDRWVYGAVVAARLRYRGLPAWQDFDGRGRDGAWFAAINAELNRRRLPAARRAFARAFGPAR